MQTVMERGNKSGLELVREILSMKTVDGKRVSKYKLANDLDVTDTAVYKWVKGTSYPSQENFNKLQEYLDYLRRLSQIRKPFGR